MGILTCNDSAKYFLMWRQLEVIEIILLASNWWNSKKNWIFQCTYVTSEGEKCSHFGLNIVYALSILLQRGRPNLPRYTSSNKVLWYFCIIRISLSGRFICLLTTNMHITVSLQIPSLHQCASPVQAKGRRKI